ncbi:YkgJ family cysteine cluster protein [Gammaproteobacteria bacterium]
MGTERHFNCTTCGKCCFGWLPLTLNDALRHAGRFPLALVWTPVPYGTRAFAVSARFGITIRLHNRKQIAVVITPTAYLPPSFPCPELTAEGQCRIHEHKPLRCRTMPFYPYREEQDQADQLVPRKGWACDISASAPVVYRNKSIVDRTDFDHERRGLLEQAPTMRVYADYVLKNMPWIHDSLGAVVQKSGGKVITSLSSFLTAIRTLDAKSLAAQQLPILNNYATKTTDIPELVEYQHNYAGWAQEMEYLASTKHQQNSTQTSPA